MVFMGCSDVQIVVVFPIRRRVPRRCALGSPDADWVHSPKIPDVQFANGRESPRRDAAHSGGERVVVPTGMHPPILRPVMSQWATK